MKISILGKILLLLFFISNSFAAVQATVDKPTFYMGDQVTLSIKASGSDVKFPQINKIGDFVVTGTSSSQQISIINGARSQTKIMQYSFEPTKSMTIPPFEITIGNKKETTNPLTISMEMPKASTKNDPIQLSIQTNKSSYYMGEPIITTTYFKYKQNAGILDAKLAEFAPNGFWIKEMQSPPPSQKGNTIRYQINNLLFAKKSGTLTIPNHFINVAKRDNRGFIKWEKVFSNPITLDIKPLPNGINVVGDFTIKADVDKTKVNQNEPINLTITIDGAGNIEDINQFELKMPKQVLYSSTPEIQSSVVKNKVLGNFIQKISIISDEPYIIPSISFSYFDLDAKEVKTISTKPIKIDVNINAKKEAPKIETMETKVEPQVVTKIEYVETDSNMKYIFGIVGLFLGVFLTYIILKLKSPKTNKEDTPLIKQIKKAKTPKELYDILLPYIQDETIKTYIHQLESTIYKNTNEPINKKTLIEYIRDNFEV